MPEAVIRVVLDTNQIISAGSGWLERDLPTRDRNIQRRILIRVAESHAGLYCGKIIGEYLEKLVDGAHPPERALKLVTYIMGAFDRVTITTARAPHPPSDPDDEVFLLCAIDGSADYLISDDHALINLKSKYANFVIGRSDDVANILGA
ncbi:MULTISPECIES: PIN domain-containing protein [Bradyrhizobium]|uniref:PIN domain-containing protein n=1 Tax=Bradyrhizobium TaxID=374 RepID=UPI000D736C41|nr:PIN domain-containing protein [Bradyrhizobium diazoefficiens]AWO87810.1 PIN domain-containing protein [Bradyrhizobium diazoefficiens]